MSTLMKNQQKIIKVYCGELCQSNSCTSDTINLSSYDYEKVTANVSTQYDKFVDNPQELRDRIIDLLQIASYIFCADRRVNRGARDSVGNVAWGRSWDFKIPVNDVKFWSTVEVRQALEKALTFMTGDRQFRLDFIESSSNILKNNRHQLMMFTAAEMTIAAEDDVDVMLFSGGLDSLAGAIDRLNLYPERKLFLVSHTSSNNTMKTQRNLAAALKKKYHNRIYPFNFECRFKKLKSRDESQRTRMFLFSAIAFAICDYYNKNELYVYENGITSINLPKQADVINARASRTTHPKTLGLLQAFYRLLNPHFKIIAPYYKLTKEEVVDIFEKHNERAMIQSSVSCSSTRDTHDISQHCGCCSQCIDRRFAMYAAGIADDDVTYPLEIEQSIVNEEASQRIGSILFFANNGIGETKYEFLRRYPSELEEAIDYWPTSPENGLEEIYQLYSRYCYSIRKAEKAIYESFKNTKAVEGSLFSRISKKLHYEKTQKDNFDEYVKSSVFVIENGGNMKYQGSCFYLSDYGLVTAQHLIMDEEYYYLSRYTEYPDKCGVVSKEINEICEDVNLDYALFKKCVDCAKYFQLGDSNSLKIGDPVKLVGFPNFYKGDSYDCLQTQIRRISQWFGAPLYLVSANVYHGASGGVVLDRKNRVVGIIRTGIRATEESEDFDKHGFVPINPVIEHINK